MRIAKFFIICTVLYVLTAGIKVFAQVVTVRKMNKQPAAATYKQVNTKNLQLVNHIKTCKPYRETLDSDLSGVDFNFLLTIDGWQDNKCIMNFQAKSQGINNSFKSIYGVDSSQAAVYTFEPNIRCAFTKAQLQSVGDSILQEQERNMGARNNMLKNPSDINLTNFYNLSDNDRKLLDILLNQNACTILNVNDSNEVFNLFFEL